jgi:hypothetical protein
MAVENKYRITVNTKSKMFRDIPEIVQNDNVIFQIDVYDGATLFVLDPTYSYKLVSLKLSGQSTIRDGVLNNGLIEFTLGTSEMTEPGKVEATVQIYDSEMKRISSAKFDYVVKKDPSLQGSLPADNTSLVIANESLLTDAINKSDQAIADSADALTKATNADANATTALSTANNVKSQFDQVVAEAGSSNPEIVLARGGEANLNARLDKFSSSLAESMTKLGTNTHSLQTTYINGNLTQTKEFDINNNLILQNDITYNTDGTIHTITETINGKQYVTTLNYVNGGLDPVNPITRSVI